MYKPKTFVKRVRVTRRQIRNKVDLVRSGAFCDFYCALNKLLPHATSSVLWSYDNVLQFGPH